MQEPTSRQPQDTRRVTLPNLGLATYRQLVAQIQAERPTERERIGRALNVLLGSAIYETGAVGSYLVQSCQDAGTYYLTSTYGCTCPDSAQRAPQGRCKHVYSAILLHAASAEAAARCMEERVWLTEKAQQALVELG